MYVYVVDSDLHVIYYNEAMRGRFPDLKTGERCYRALCGREEPCYACPVWNDNGENTLFYNRVMQKWVEVSKGQVEWPGEGECTIVFFKEIDEGNKNLFYNLTHTDVYDELYEMNLTANTYRILYHQSDKYIAPAMEGKLDEMCWDSADHRVHPEDREKFLEFWNLRAIAHSMEQGKGRIMRGEFRKKLKQGGYCWTVQIVVPLTAGPGDDLTILCFIQDINEQKVRELGCGIRAGEEERDRLTGLLGKDAFYAAAAKLLREKTDWKFCIVAIDTEHFKLFNEWFGTETGNDYLQGIGKRLRELEKSGNCVSGYMGNDDFALVLQKDEELIGNLLDQMMKDMEQYGNTAGFMPAFGICPIEKGHVPLSVLYDRAIIAMEKVKGNYSTRSCWYDASIGRQMEEDQVLLSEIQRALKDEEFVFYAQPKCNMTTGKIVGLESLIRWNHPERGIIAPNDFIPLLERNGFITNLDMYMWEKVCVNVRRWIDEGHRPIPISVNVSRIDVYAVDVPSVFEKLTDTYHLSPELIEIEITESAYAQDYEAIIKVVKELRRMGFTVLMDDFGSGYSSLNMLKDVEVDILKIDMKFLDLDEDSMGRGVGILEAVVRMARLMGIRVIAEGVETKEQVDFLLKMGCIYAQGYYYYKPLAIETFEPLLACENNVDFRGIRAEQIEQLKLSDMMNGDMDSESILNNMLGGVAFYDVYGEHVKILKVNEQFYRITKKSPVDMEEYKDRMLDFVYEADRKEMLKLFEQAEKTVVTGAQGDIRWQFDENRMWMHLRIFFLRKQDGHSLFYGGVSDITEQKSRERKLEKVCETLTKCSDLAR